MHQQLCNMHQQKWPKCLIVNFNGGHRGSEFLTGPQLLAVSGTAPYRRTDPKIHAWRSQKQSSPDGNHDERVISQCSVQSRWSWWCRCIQRRHLCIVRCLEAVGCWMRAVRGEGRFEGHLVKLIFSRRDGCCQCSGETRW